MIRVNGGTSQQKEIATKVAKWCCEYYNISPVVHIRLRPYEDCWGYCVEGRMKGSYRIMIAYNQSLRDFIATVVHEMIHVKQYVRGELVDLIRTPTTCKWMGETVDWTKLEDNEPWEIETYERSNILYEEWKCYRNI